jgi:hypothetical protein
VNRLDKGAVSAKAVDVVQHGRFDGEVLARARVDGVVPIRKSTSVVAFFLEGTFVFTEKETVPWEEEACCWLVGLFGVMTEEIRAGVVYPWSLHLVLGSKGLVVSRCARILAVTGCWDGM